jgi:hypothetical protein
MDSPPVDACSLGEKEFPKVGFHMATIWQSIQVELQTATRCQARGEIAKEEFPLGSSPGGFVSVPIETSHMGSNEIKRRSSIGQSLKRFDSMDNALETEQGNCLAKNGFLVQVHAKDIMTEALGDMQEVSRAAANVQNAQFWGGPSDAQVAHTLDICAHPILEIEIFLWRNTIVWVEITRLNGVKRIAIDRIDERLWIERIRQSQERGFGAIVSVAIDELLELVREAHVCPMLASPRTSQQLCQRDAADHGE